MQITDEMVEVVARAMYNSKRGLVRDIPPPSWGSAADIIQDEWRALARAGLRAAGTVAAVHLCATCAQSMCRRRRDIEDACEDPLFPARAVVVKCEAHVAKKDVQEVAEGA